ncbi:MULTISPECIES: hypothetical protein [Clostridium]|uniref:rRNA biogenesis protein rrp5 n=1 Tax=Clostridium faecium TaxID=2762223 RepID=A0ABR8YS26_9CLOT|nr:MULTISPECIES: hypothetical protein [Clostridium]MBD8046781.1 hypothetical protein [Clostridium faecium]
MKITAEFNSNEELLNFINTFGANALVGTTKQETTVIEKKEDKKEVIKKENPVKEETKVEKKESPKVEEAEVKEEPKEEDTKPEITKEMVRATFTKLIQAGKQKEAKELTAKYGASKLPDLKEEHYAAVMKEAEALL